MSKEKLQPDTFNEPVLDTDFESIIPWNGEHDTGYDARTKLDRNFARVKNDFYNLISYFITVINGLDERFLMKITPDKTDYLLKLLGGIVSPYLQSPDFVPGSMGAGHTIKTNADGSSHAEVDTILVRKKAIFQLLEILKTELGGSSFLFNASGARATITRVERMESEAFFIDGDKAYFSNDDEVFFPDVYRCYFMVDDGDTAIENLFKVGDMVRSQTFNIETGIHDGISNHYWWRLVVGKGKDYIDISSVDMDEGSNEPSAGDVIVQLGNVYDIDRQAAIVMSAYGDGAPSLTMYQGIDSYSLSGKDVFNVYYDKVEKECIVKIFGSGFWGARDEASFIKFNQKTKKFDIKANVEIIGGFNDTIAQSIGYSDYKSLIEEASKGKTIMKGGYINLEVLDAKTIITSDLISSAIKTKELNVNDKFTVSPEGILKTVEGIFEKGTIKDCIFKSLKSSDNSFVYDETGLKLVGELSTGTQAEHVVIGKGGTADIKQYDALNREVADWFVYQESGFRITRSRMQLNQWSEGDGSIPSLSCIIAPGSITLSDKSNNRIEVNKDFIFFKDSNGEYYGQSGSIDVITELTYDFNGRVTGGIKGKLYFKGGIIYGKG